MSYLLNVVDHPEIREHVRRKDEQLAGFLKGMVVNPERMGEVTNNLFYHALCMSRQTVNLEGHLLERIYGIKNTPNPRDYGPRHQ